MNKTSVSNTTDIGESLRSNAFKNRITSKDIVVVAVTLALMIGFSALPFVFLIPLLFTAATRSIKMTTFMGLCFGVISYLYSLMGGSIVALAFVEKPWIAIVPRIMVGFLAGGSFHLSKKLIKGNGKISKILPYIISAAVGSLSNTGLVVGLFAIFMPNTIYGDITMYVYIPTMLISGLIEVIICVTVLPPLAITVSKALKLNDNRKQLNKNNTDKSSEQGKA